MCCVFTLRNISTALNYVPYIIVLPTTTTVRVPAIGPTSRVRVMGAVPVLLSDTATGMGLSSGNHHQKHDLLFAQGMCKINDNGFSLSHTKFHHTPAKNLRTPLRSLPFKEVTTYK